MRTSIRVCIASALPSSLLTRFVVRIVIHIAILCGHQESMTRARDCDAFARLTVVVQHGIVVIIVFRVRVLVVWCLNGQVTGS